MYKIINIFQNNIILTLISSHGMTDLIFYNHYWLWGIYLMTFISFCFLPKLLIKIIFTWLSILHFYYDSDILGGTTVGFVLPYIVYRVKDFNTALCIENIYLSLIHVPLHYWRMWNCINSYVFIVLLISHIFMYLLIKNTRELIENYKIKIIENDVFLITIGSVICSHIIWNFHIHPSSYPPYLNYTSCILVGD